MFFVRDVRHQYQISQVPKKEIGYKEMKKLLGIVFLLAAAQYCILVLLAGQVWMSTSGH